MGLVNSEPWPAILAFYEGLSSSGFPCEGMTALVRKLTASPYAKGGLFGATSMHTLLIAQNPQFERDREVLQIEQQGLSLTFTFIEGPYVKVRWSRSYPLDAGFEALEHFLLDLKKWFRR